MLSLIICISKSLKQFSYGLFFFGIIPILALHRKLVFLIRKVDVIDRVTYDQAKISQSYFLLSGSRVVY